MNPLSAHATNTGAASAQAISVEPNIALGYAGRACGKAQSEDFFDFARPAPDDFVIGGLVFSLADGLSGGAGRRAAEICVRATLADYYGAPAHWTIPRKLDCVITACNSWLHSNNQRAPDSQRMFSTLSVLVLRDSELHIAHVGDCRIYRVRRGILEPLTTDHVWPHHGMRHVLRRAIGLEQFVPVEFWSDILVAGDRFLMLSDGVWEVIGERGVREVVDRNLDPGACAQLLVSKAVDKQRDYYGRNDATAAVIQS